MRAGRSVSRRGRFVATATLVIAAVAFLVWRMTDDPGATSRNVPASTLPQTPTFAVVGDLVCDPDNPRFDGGEGEDGECMHQAVYELIDPANEDRVFSPDRLVIPGDTQYDDGEYDDFFADGAYDDTFGRLLDLTWAVPGNHDYGVDDAEGYFDYFNGVGEDDGPAGERGKGYYSHAVACDEDGDECAWRFVFLNTELGGDDWDEEMQWLAGEMASYEEECLAVVGHTAPFTTADHFDGESNSGESMLEMWDVLYRGEDESLDAARTADLLLVGHSHAYLRYVAQNDTVEMEDVEDAGADHPVAQADESGVTEILVGTGGESTDEDDAFLEEDPNEAYHDVDVYGLLKLDLGTGDDRSSWSAEFYEIGSERGDEPADSASGDCH